MGGGYVGHDVNAYNARLATAIALFLASMDLTRGGGRAWSREQMTHGFRTATTKSNREQSGNISGQSATYKSRRPEQAGKSPNRPSINLCLLFANMRKLRSIRRGSCFTQISSARSHLGQRLAWRTTTDVTKQPPGIRDRSSTGAIPVVGSALGSTADIASILVSVVEESFRKNACLHSDVLFRAPCLRVVGFGQDCAVADGANHQYGRCERLGPLQPMTANVVCLQGVDGETCAHLARHRASNHAGREHDVTAVLLTSFQHESSHIVEDERRHNAGGTHLRRK